MSVNVTSNTHTATAKVGKDTIENAEYFSFSSSFDRPKRDLSFKDKVSNKGKMGQTISTHSNATIFSGMRWV